MGEKHRVYDYEIKLAAAADVVEGGLTKQEETARHGVANLASLDRWVRAYVAEALMPKPKDRPKSDRGEFSVKSREQELEDENRRLRAEIAY